MSQNKNNCLKCGQEIDPQSDQTHKCEEDKISQLSQAGENKLHAHHF